MWSLSDVIRETLNPQMDEFLQHFQIQVRAVPKAYGLGEEMRNRSKETIKDQVAAAVAGQYIDFTDGLDGGLGALADLMRLELPEHEEGGGQFVDANGMELGEAFFHGILLQALLKGVDPRTDLNALSAQQMGLTPKTYLKAWTDSLTELCRSVTKYFIATNPDNSIREEILKRLYEGLEAAVDILTIFEGVPPNVIDAGNRFGFKNSFRSRMGRIRGAAGRVSSEITLLQVSNNHEISLQKMFEGFIKRIEQMMPKG